MLVRFSSHLSTLPLGAVHTLLSIQVTGRLRSTVYCDVGCHGWDVFCDVANPDHRIP